jgi:hypothetical protein
MGWYSLIGALSGHDLAPAFLGEKGFFILSDATFVGYQGQWFS